MDETLGCKVISLVSVGAGTTRNPELIRTAKLLLMHFWEHKYIQSLAKYQTAEHSWY